MSRRAVNGIGGLIQYISQASRIPKGSNSRLILQRRAIMYLYNARVQTDKHKARQKSVQRIMHTCIQNIE